jgi:hypothetical protein
MLLSQMKGSFAGTLSANGRLLTDQATGAAREDQSDSFPWRGSVRYPTAVHELEYFTPSARLDCEDGRTLLIELGDPYCSNDGQWVTSKFYSYGLTRRRHHTVWSRVFGSTRLDPFEWNLFLEGSRILVQEISTPSPRIGFRRKRASPGSIRCHHVPNCRRSPSLRTRFTDSIYRPRNGQR